MVYSRNKIKISIIIIASLLILTSCSFESYIPKETSSQNDFYDFEDLYRNSAMEILDYGMEVFISHSSVYKHELLKDISGLYMVDIKNNSISPLKSQNIEILFSSCNVKMIDTLIYNGISVCSFGFSTPNHDFDWGYYYISSDEPIYLGDFDADLEENEKGYTYEYKVSALTKISYYTEKLSDNFYYYEIK